MKRLRLPGFVMGAVTTLLIASTAMADGPGEEVLAKMDVSMTRAADQYFEYDVIVEEKGRDPRLMQLLVYVKGEMRFTEFMAPGDMKGTKALVRARDQMYIYLPAYSKVRRVASSMTSGGFMGTTFSNDDISTIVYGPVYAGTLLSESDAAWVVEGLAREGVKTPYAKLEFTISKEFEQPTQIRYFNKKGLHVKTETRTDYSCEGDVCNAEVMTMTDHTRGDASTQLVRTGWKVNTGVGDDVFSVRNLQ